MQTPILSRRQLLKSASLAALVPALIAATPSYAQDPVQIPAPVAALERPNILLVLSDDQSARFVGCYGDAVIRTPNIDGFAAQGVRFDRAYVSAPQCVPARASILTGKNPVALDMTRFSAPLPADETTFPELLRSGANYYTGLCGRSYHLDGSGGMADETRRAFDRYDLRTFPRRMDYVRSGNRVQALEQMNEFLERVPGGRPWFLQVGFQDPHRPLDANAVSPPHDPAALKLPPFMPDTPELRADMARYYDEVARLDGDFGRVLKVLDERGLSENTLVIFMGDNGAALLRGKGTLYEIGVRVPLIMRWPGVTRPGSSSALSSSEDLAPTFLQAAGLPVPPDITGRSLVPLLRGTPAEVETETAARRTIFSERGAHGSTLPHGSQAFDLSRCVVSPTHKLIYNALWQLPFNPVDFGNQPFWNEIKTMHAQGQLAPRFSELYFTPTRPMFELYDLSNDPNELTNLADTPDNAALELELKGALQEWMILNRDFLPLPIAPPAKSAKAQEPID